MNECGRLVELVNGNRDTRKVTTPNLSVLCGAA